MALGGACGGDGGVSRATGRDAPELGDCFSGWNTHAFSCSSLLIWLPFFPRLAYILKLSNENEWGNGAQHLLSPWKAVLEKVPAVNGIPIVVLFWQLQVPIYPWPSKGHPACLSTGFNLTVSNMSHVCEFIYVVWMGELATTTLPQEGSPVILFVEDLDNRKDPWLSS